jgi:hypothetical protein
MPGPCSGVAQAFGQQEVDHEVTRQKKTEEATGVAALLRLLWVWV